MGKILLIIAIFLFTNVMFSCEPKLFRGTGLITSLFWTLLAIFLMW